MGQAKNRKAEIENLKKLGVKTKKIVKAAFLYKSDKDDGICLSFDSSVMSDVNYGVKTFIDAVEGCDEEDCSTEECLEQLKYAIKGYNLICYGQETQPANFGSLPVKIEIPKGKSEEYATYITIIATDILLLVKRGIIKQDEYNGTLYAYTD